MSHPDRKCNGGPLGPWCGKPATVVCTDVHGLQWFACSDSEHHKAEHVGPVSTEPIDEWFKRVDAAVAAERGGS